MSKLTDIKHRIKQLDGGAFQNLCDAYLCCRGYGTGYSLGMNTGSDKTAKGNPDTYFLTMNDKYVFVMYTTQDTDFARKILEDIEKCFEPQKTGISPEDVVEIIYCHTYGRLSAGDDQKLRKYCKERNTALTLIGLDQLGNDIYFKYTRLANDHLGIRVDTGQISSISEFTLIHDANKMSAPLNTDFLFREEELKAAKEKLRLKNSLIISGPAGVGKTRLALKLCEEFAGEDGYRVLCIKGNGLELYEDLVAALEPEEDYLVFVDDANELTSLHFVLDYLSKGAIGKKHIKKVVITVRDYARQQVVNQVLEVEKPEILKVGLLKDEDIKKMMEIFFGITNHLYLKRIIAIAEGNARLAMLAGKISAEAENLDSIRDASELYDNYYSKQIEKIVDSRTAIASAGIMAFFQALHIDSLDRLEPIFTAMDLTADLFVADLKLLHDMEFVDLCYDTAAKISDQSFSNYLIKLVFVDKRIIPLSQMIESCFFINRERTISACNILLNVFSDERVQEYIDQQINLVWDHLEPDKNSFFSFFKAFHVIRPTQTLLYIKDLIAQEMDHSFDVRSIVFKKNNSEKTVDDDIIGILCNFKMHLQLPIAVDLLLQYYQKRPDLFEQIYSALVSHFGVDKDSPRSGYYTQKTVAERLCAVVKQNPSEENLLLFVRTAEQYLEMSFSRTEGGRQRTFTFYTMPLTMHEAVLEYRKMLLEQLLEIYAYGKCCTEIESLLLDYCGERGAEINYEIVNRELVSVIKFFTLFSADSLYHCVIAEHIMDVAQRAKYDNTNPLTRFLVSHKYNIYHALKVNRRETLHSDLHKRESWHKKRVQKLVSCYQLPQFLYLIEVCKECLQTFDPEARLLSSGIAFAIDAFSANRELYVGAVKAYIDADTPYDVRADDILRNLFAMMRAEDVKSLITARDFSQKNTWMWQFYVELPAEQISARWAKDLLLYLQDVPKHVRSSPYRPIDRIKKYESVYKNIILDASRIIAEHYEDSPFVFSLYFFFIVNSVGIESADVATEYGSNILLLEDIYLKYITYSKNEDSHGELLAEIVKRDHGFLKIYLETMLKKLPNLIGVHEEWAARLTFVWKEKSFVSYMDTISNYIFERIGEKRWTYSAIINQILLNKKDGIEVTEKQDEWIYRTIKQYYTDKERLYGLFSGIAEHSIERRKKALEVFLSLNSDYTLFESLPLESSYLGGWGSMIPYMQARIEYLTSLLPMLSGLNFLKHKLRIEKEIDSWRKKIKGEEIRELLASFG